MPPRSKKTPPLEKCESCESKDVRYANIAEGGRGARAVKCARCADEAVGWRCIVSRRDCETEGCTGLPNFFPVFERTKESVDLLKVVRGSRCKSHKKAADGCTMAVCSFPDCLTRPSYAVEGATVPRFCAAHAEGSCRYVLRKKCEETECTRGALVCRIDAPTKPVFCTTHAPKTPEYIHLSTPRCKFTISTTALNRGGRCRKEAVWRRKGEKLASFCDDHSPDAAADFVRKKSRPNVKRSAPPPGRKISQVKIVDDK
jgi:hypothetical protein